MSSVYVVCWIFFKLFKPIYAYRLTVWTQIRLLLEEQSDLGPHCLQKMTFKITSWWQSRRQLLWLAVEVLINILEVFHTIVSLNFSLIFRPLICWISLNPEKDDHEEPLLYLTRVHRTRLRILCSLRHVQCCQMCHLVEFFALLQRPNWSIDAKMLFLSCRHPLVILRQTVKWTLIS